MNRRNRAVAAVVSMTALLAAGTDSRAEVSDDQFLLLLGRTPITASSTDEPPTITKSAAECVRVVAGVDEALYADMPEEMIDAIKSECNAEIVAYLENEDRNPTGLQMSDVARPEFAQRVATLRQSGRAAVQDQNQQRQEAREAERADQQQERQAAIMDRQQTAIEDAQTQLEDLKANLPDRLAAVATACAEFDQEKAALRQRNRRAPVLNRASGSSACRSSFAERMERQLVTIEERVGRMEVRDNTTAIPTMPNLRNLDPDWMTNEVQSLEEQTAQMREG